FYDLHVANQSQLAGQALHSIGLLYEIERDVRDRLEQFHLIRVRLLGAIRITICVDGRSVGRVSVA
ncbi:hypothetical protein, partial [Azotobacter armeniacus]